MDGKAEREYEEFVAGLPEGACRVRFEGETDGERDGSGGDLAEVVERVAHRNALKKLPPEVSRQMDDVAKTLACLPPSLADALEHVTAKLISTIDARMHSDPRDLSADASGAKARPVGRGGQGGDDKVLSRGGAGEDPMSFEIRSHVQVQERHTAHFVGGEKLVGDICHFVMDRPEAARPVYVVEGEGHGVGVSALMSRVSQVLVERMREKMLAGRVITRFVGATQQSRYLEPLVHSLVLELRGQMQLSATLGDDLDKHGQVLGFRV